MNYKKNSNSLARNRKSETLLEPISQHNIETMETRWNSSVLAEEYKKYLNYLSPKQRQQQEMVMRANNNTAFQILSAPLILAKQQQQLIEGHSQGHCYIRKQLMSANNEYQKSSEYSRNKKVSLLYNDHATVSSVSGSATSTQKSSANQQQSRHSNGLLLGTRAFHSLNDFQHKKESFPLMVSATTITPVTNNSIQIQLNNKNSKALTMNAPTMSPTLNGIQRMPQTLDQQLIEKQFHNNCWKPFLAQHENSQRVNHINNNNDKHFAQIIPQLASRDRPTNNTTFDKSGQRSTAMVTNNHNKWRNILPEMITTRNDFRYSSSITVKQYLELNRAKQKQQYLEQNRAKQKQQYLEQKQQRYELSRESQKMAEKSMKWETIEVNNNNKNSPCATITPLNKVIFVSNSAKNEENETKEDIIEWKIIEKMLKKMLKIEKKTKILIEHGHFGDSVQEKNDQNENENELMFENMNKNHKNIEEMDFIKTLDLIKSRDLRRKPRAYLNAKHPLNEISRAIYAGIATKRAIMDFTRDNNTEEEEYSDSERVNNNNRKRRKLFQNSSESEAEVSRLPLKWSFVLQSMDFCSPLGSRIIAVHRDFQHA